MTEQQATAGWRAQAPGSLMLMGEHAVLHGKHALVCAVDSRLSVTLTPRRDGRVHITSALGEDEAPLDALPLRDPFRFIWASLRSVPGGLSAGCDLTVQSDFSDRIGLGSSAAVSVATLAVLEAWAGRALDHTALARRATAVIRAVQGEASGADAAASVFGGLLEYRAQPLKIEPLCAIHPLTLIYSGYKTPTPQVIARVEQERRRRPALYDGFFFEIDECVRTAVDAVCRDQWAELGMLMDQNHALMVALGVSDGTMDGIVSALRRDPGILGAKISGSGLGDCAVGLGTAREWRLPYASIPCAMTNRGVHVEAI
jgi:mevalonate kinase